MQRASSEIPTTLQGAIVTICGIMDSVSRDELKAALVAAGAIVTGSVNKHTTLVVGGWNVTVETSRKLQIAAEMGIPIIGEKEAIQMLRDRKTITPENSFPVMATPDQAIANVIAMVMLQAGTTELLIDNLTRAKVMAGGYMVTIDRDAINNGTRFTLVKEDRDAAV